MSITISTDVFCDICGNWFHGTTSHKSEIRCARWLAKDAGWCRRLIGGKMSDICPDCIEKHADKEYGMA